jgi:hypothetical protein
MAQGEYRRDGNAILPGQPYLGFVAHALNQIFEPNSGLRQKVMTPSGHQEKPVEFVHDPWRAAYFIRQPFSFCSSNLSLKAILVQSLEQLLQSRIQIQFVKPIGTSWLETRLHNMIFQQWAELGVPVNFSFAFPL